MPNKSSIFKKSNKIIFRAAHVISLFGLLLVTGSCVVETISLKESNDVRLLKAKDWFDINEIYLGNNGTPSNHSAAAKAAISNLKKVPDWERYMKHVGKKGEEVWEIPLDYNGLFISVSEGKPFPKSVYHSMIMFSDGSEYRVYILKVVPDNPEFIFQKKDYLSINYLKYGDDFSGEYKFFEWDESFIGGFVVENGKMVRSIIRK